MKYRWLTVIRDILRSEMNYFVLLSVWIVADAFLKVDSNIWGKLLFGIVPVVFYAFRRWIKSLILFTILHILLPYLIMMLWPGDMRIKIVTGIVLIVMAIMSFAGRLKKSKPGEDNIHPTVAIGVMCITSLACGFLGYPLYSKWISGLGLTFAVFFFTMTYLTNFMWFDFMGRKTITHMPTKRTLRSSFPLAAGFTALATLIIMIVLNDQIMDRITIFARTLWIGFLRWLVSLLPVTEEKVLPDYYVTDTSGADALQELAKGIKPSPIWMFLEKLIMILATMFLIFLGLFIIYYIIVGIIRGFRPVEKVKIQKLSDDAEEVRERVEANVRGNGDRQLLFAFTPADKIRKMYYKAVLHYRTNETFKPQYLTAREFAAIFKDEKYEAAMGLAHLYEKARYSAISCSKEDVKEAKRYSGQL